MVPKAGVKHYLTHFHFFCRAHKDGSGGETQIGTPPDAQADIPKNRSNLPQVSPTTFLLNSLNPRLHQQDQVRQLPRDLR